MKQLILISGSITNYRLACTIVVGNEILCQRLMGETLRRATCLQRWTLHCTIFSSLRIHLLMAISLQRSPTSFLKVNRASASRILLFHTHLNARLYFFWPHRFSWLTTWIYKCSPIMYSSLILERFVICSGSNYPLI